MVDPCFWWAQGKACKRSHLHSYFLSFYRCSKLLLLSDWDVGRFLGTPPETSEDHLWCQLRRRKNVWGVDWDVNIHWGVDWDVGRLLGASTETSRKNRKIRITLAMVIFMPAAKDSRPLGLAEVGSYQKPAQKSHAFACAPFIRNMESGSLQTCTRICRPRLPLINFRWVERGSLYATPDWPKNWFHI